MRLLRVVWVLTITVHQVTGLLAPYSKELCTSEQLVHFATIYFTMRRMKLHMYQDDIVQLHSATRMSSMQQLTTAAQKQAMTTWCLFPHG